MALGGRVMGTLFVLGAGALAVTAVIAAPTVLRAARPLVRETLRRGLKVYEQTRAAAAEFAEDVEDLMAEVKSDLAPKPGAETPVKHHESV